MMKNIWYYLPILILLIVLTPNTGHHFDIQFWVTWSTYNLTHGWSKIYESGTDYLPLYHYILGTFGRIQGSPEEIAANIGYMKCFNLLFEFGSTLILAMLLRRNGFSNKMSFIFSLFYLCNLAVLHNSLIWGQVDAILAFFCFAAVIATHLRYYALGAVLFILAVNMKLQAIIFLPVIPAIMATHPLEKGWRDIVYPILAAILTQFVILLPFLIEGQANEVLRVALESKGKIPVLSMAAHNVWYLVFSGDFLYSSDTQKWLGISYNNWGLLMFFTTSFFTLLLPLKFFIERFTKKVVQPLTLRQVLIIGTLIPLVFFYFNTQMHERYSHPALIFGIAYSLIFRRWTIFILLSFAVFQNMEGTLMAFGWKNYHTLIFSPRFISVIFLLSILHLLYDLYKRIRPLSLTTQFEHHEV
jgi:Gpi18-like mannosyltransferase